MFDGNHFFQSFFGNTGQPIQHIHEHIEHNDAILEIVTCDIQNDCRCVYEEALERAKERLKHLPYWKISGKGWKLPNVPE